MTEAQKAAVATMKKTIRVTIEKVIEIELMPSMFGGLTEAEYIAQFKQGLWHIDGLDDIYTYAARMAAHHGGGMEHDGLVWQAAHGPVPKGHIVVFKPGRRSAELSRIILDAVECISRAEHARRNHPRSKSPELGRLVQLRGAITRQINKRSRDNTPNEGATP